MKTKGLIFILLFITSLGFGQNATFEWAANIGGSLSDEATVSTTNYAGDIFIAGTFKGTADLDPGPAVSNFTSHGNTDVFVVKLSATGSFIWAVAFGGTGWDVVKSIMYENSSVMILGNFSGTVDFDPGTGTSNKTSAGGNDVFFLKLSNSGAFSSVQTFGGTSNDNAYDFAFDSSTGSICIVGEFQGTCDFDPSTSVANKTSNGNKDIFLLKLSAAGNFQWVNAMGGTDDDIATDVALSNGNIVVAGTFRGGPVDFDPGTGVHNVSTNGYMEDIFVEKLTSSGAFTWVKTTGGFDGERMMGMDVDASGNVYSTGDFFMQVDFNPGTGVYNLSSHPSGNDIFIQKLDSNGNFVWAKSFGGNSPDLSYDLKIGSDGSVFTYGAFSSATIDLNPNADSLIFTKLGTSFGDDIFIQKLNSAGSFVYAKTFGTTWFDRASTISIDDSMNVILLGDFEGDTMFISTVNGVTQLINNGFVDAFIIKMKETQPEIIPSQSSFSAPPFSLSFQNNTGDSTNIRWFWDFGDGSFSNHMNPAHTYAYNGTYQVVLLAVDTITGNADTTSTEIICSGGPTNNCNFSATLNQIGAAIICPNDSFKFSVAQGSNLTYSWFFNGITIQGAHDSVFYGQSQGFYMAVVSNANCSQTTDYFALANYPASQPVITSFGNISPCSNDSIQLTTSNYASYLWNTGDTSSSIYVSQSGRYVVQGSDANGCVNTSAEKVINASLADIPSICIVGFDSVNNHNVVVWEAPVTNKIDSFIVYRESFIANDYARIGAEPYAGNRYFVDVNSNSSIKQYRYRISSLDSCGTETPMSNVHSTIHLMVNATMGGHWNLIWRPYEGLTITSYKIYRGTDSLNLQLIKQVSGNSFSYTDLNNPIGNIYYQIEAVTNSNCAVYNKIKSNSFNTSHAGGLGFQSVANELSGVNIYPNPTKGKLTIAFDSGNSTKLALHIYNLLGEEIYNEALDSHQGATKVIDLSNQPKGVYMVVLLSKDHKAYRGKIVVQ